jgi:hypothetical protein
MTVTPPRSNPRVQAALRTIKRGRRHLIRFPGASKTLCSEPAPADAICFMPGATAAIPLEDRQRLCPGCVRRFHGVRSTDQLPLRGH